MVEVLVFVEGELEPTRLLCVRLTEMTLFPDLHESAVGVGIDGVDVGTLQSLDQFVGSWMAKTAV